jgi:hypothetical protein
MHLAKASAAASRVRVGWAVVCGPRPLAGIKCLQSFEAALNWGAPTGILSLGSFVARGIGEVRHPVGAHAAGVGDQSVLRRPGARRGGAAAAAGGEQQEGGGRDDGGGDEGGPGVLGVRDVRFTLTGSLGNSWLGLSR